MKRIRLLIALIVLSTASVNANPVAITYFSELMFDSTGWKLELHCFYTGGEIISLDGWYLISSTDSAGLKPGMKLSDTSYLVITENELSGNFNINPKGDTVYLYSAENEFMDFIELGQEIQYIVPGLNVSICRYDYGRYYLDYSPTIGFQNDSLDATGSIKGYVVDAADNPAKNLKIIYDDIMVHAEVVYTDSLGHFFIPSALAKSTYFSMSNGIESTHVKLFVFPRQVHTLNIKLNWIITSVPDDESSNMNFNLLQNFPNPFNPSTIINFTLTAGDNVTLKIYDALGREIETILNNFMAAGNHKIDFDASHLASGTYYYQLKSNGKIITKKMVLQR